MERPIAKLHDKLSQYYVLLIYFIERCFRALGTELAHQNERTLRHKASVQKSETVA